MITPKWMSLFPAAAAGQFGEGCFGKRWADYNTCIHEFQEEMQDRRTKVAPRRTLSPISPKNLQFWPRRSAILTGVAIGEKICHNNNE